MCTKEQVEAISAIAAKHAVEELMKTIGIDVTQTEEIRHFQANMMFLMRLRRISEKLGLTIILTAGAIITGGVITLIWDVVKSKTGG